MSTAGQPPAPLELRPAEDCRYDELSLGEVMLRLDPGEGRVRTTRQFSVWEGGGEYNVARGLRRCFGLRTAVVTALADNDIGRLIEDLMLQGGVDLSFLRWVPYDGIGRKARNGLNFTERGFGVRGAVGVSDRAYSAASQIRPGEVDWEHIFGELGVRWFHTGGIYAALSETTPEVITEAMESARRHGTVVSFDLNYRPSLGRTSGVRPRAREVNRGLASLVDVMLGNEEDFTACLGIEVPGGDPSFASVEMDNFKAMIEQVRRGIHQSEGGGYELADGSFGNGERLGRCCLGPGWFRRVGATPEPRDPRPGRRWRQLCFRADLRPHGERRPAGGGRVRGHARRIGHDNAGRHQHGEPC